MTDTMDSTTIAGWIGHKVRCRGVDGNGASVVAIGELYHFRMVAEGAVIDQVARLDQEGGPITIYGNEDTLIICQLID